MPAGSIEAVKSSKVTRSSERTERKVQRKSEQVEKLQQRRETKQRSDEAAVVKLSKQGNEDKNTESVKGQPSSSPAPTSAPAKSADAASTPSPAPDVKRKENFIGSTAGAKVVNFAVQGGQGGDRLAIFAPGEGPNAKKVSEPKAKEPAKQAEPKSVDTQA